MENFKPIRGMKIKIYDKRATILYVRSKYVFLVGFDEEWNFGHDGIYDDTSGYVPSRYSDNDKCWMVDTHFTKVQEILTNELEVL